ncbi:hypothetical protein I4U23_030283 [Adineta vaga]|nr:hypothetical protein I4U23_030283 [Adineta vaga]
MSSNNKNSLPKMNRSRWGHPLVLFASVIGLAGSSAVYYAQIRARQKARNLFLQTSFYQEALELTRGYKPIVDKLIEPIEPLLVDTTSKFNTLSPLGAQVEIPVRGAERSGIIYCYATRESVDDEWHVDKLEFKTGNQPQSFLFYDRDLRKTSSTPSSTK